MRGSSLATALVFAVVASTYADDNPLIQTGSRPCYSPYQVQDCCPPGAVPGTTMPSEPKSADGNAAPAAPDLFAGATEAGTQPGATFNPNVFGDLIGISGIRNVTFPGRNGATPTVRAVRGLPLSGQYNGFKITDNESPRPVDRVYFSYNNYANVGGSQVGPGIGSITVNRELVGFEKTFLSGDASIGLRLPFIQINGFSEIQSQVVGDLSIIAKFAWINDRQTGNVFSTGLVVTAPTGGGDSNILLADGSLAPHSTLFQPWAGWIYNWRDLYFQGFSSVVVPSDSRDPSILFNSIAMGYWLYRSNNDRFLQGFVPTVEVHVNTPLNHDNPNDVIFFENQVNLTTGAYVVFPRMTLGGAVCIPLVGPKPYSIEAMASMNFRF